MSTNPTPIQALDQDLLGQAVTEVEQINQAYPTEVPALTHEQKAVLAYQMWQDAGAVPDSPLTLNFWLAAESELETATPQP